MKHTGFYGLSDARSALLTHKLVEVRGGGAREKRRRFRKEKNSTTARLGVQSMRLCIHSRHNYLL